ncbi:SPOR domain-containing protein [Rhodobacteraceae bacterium B1Z28]|uniref:SPOR domain-containing protein n=1 Tax=Ruegeria haliotis TaxID=2747601 RepID=A0ABX2PNM5_9RHOB|nr:SPOR domain-containing protein [Ruegeria haliotis]NVO54694.1 SPOR domain-containing protein [Ruegeria haliotis]
MKRAIETRPGPKRLAFLALTLAVLSGCDEFPGSTEKPEENSDAIELLPQITSGSQRDVEAPDVFEVTEAGLWDGRPSLGGIWVAHPDVTQPERVVIKNDANNKTVIGALFRRERSQPGPALQVSSAAAEKLGMLAGSPTKINVVALRREAVEETPPAPEEDAPTAESAEKDTAAPAAEATSDTSVEPAAAEPEKPAKRKWWQKKEPVAAVAGTAGAAAVVSEEATETATETVTEAVTSPTLTDAPVAAPAEKPAKRKWWQKKEPNEITETPLDPIAGAAAAIDATEAAPAATTAAAATTASSLTKPYVQIGTFGVEANANSAAEKIRRNGMSADVRELKTEDKTVWRVLVGPASTRAERKAIQNDVKDLGFTDAFTASN